MKIYLMLLDGTLQVSSSSSMQTASRQNHGSVLIKKLLIFRWISNDFYVDKDAALLSAVNIGRVLS